MFQILGPRNEMLSVLLYTKFTAGMANSELCLRLYSCSLFFSNNSVIVGED